MSENHATDLVTRLRETLTGEDTDEAMWRRIIRERQEAAAELERQQAEIASLRITLGGRTFSADVPEPVGCPMPGACSQVREIKRLRAEVAQAYDRGYEAGTYNGMGEDG